MTTCDTQQPASSLATHAGMQTMLVASEPGATRACWLNVLVPSASSPDIVLDAVPTPSAACGCCLVNTGPLKPLGRQAPNRSEVHRSFQIQAVASTLVLSNRAAMYCNWCFTVSWQRPRW
jgi:hypothetical protein